MAEYNVVFEICVLLKIPSSNHNLLMILYYALFNIP